VTVKLLAFMAAVMDLGLMHGLWIDQLVRVLEQLGIMTGWLFPDDDGSQQRLWRTTIWHAPSIVGLLQELQMLVWTSQRLTLNGHAVGILVAPRSCMDLSMSSTLIKSNY